MPPDTKGLYTGVDTMVAVSVPHVLQGPPAHAGEVLSNAVSARDEEDAEARDHDRVAAPSPRGSPVNSRWKPGR